jgi:glutathione peroxidase-family protein
MKKIPVLLLFITLFACSKQQKAVVQGNLVNGSNKFVFIDVIKKEGVVTVDSMKIGTGGKFNFTIPMSVPGFYQLRFKDDQAMTILLFPKEKVRIHGDYDNFFETKTIEGSAETQKLNALDDSLRTVNNKLMKIAGLYDRLKVTPGNESKTDSLSRLFNQIAENYRKFSIKFILENLSSLTAVDALYQQYFTGVYVFNSTRDVQYYKLVSDTLSKYFPKVGMVNLLNDNYTEMISNLEKAKLQQIVKNADNHVPELDLTGQNGKQTSLSSLRGKVVLLTFWSVNQPESIENLGGLKKVYRKYHGKGFEVYQVCVNKSISEWKNALAAHEIPWLSVCDTTFPNSRTRDLYNINSLPMNYLINRDQTDILAKNISPEDLINKLAEVLK